MSKTVELTGDTELLAAKVARLRGASIEQVIAEAVADSARKAGILPESAITTPEEIIRALDDLSRRHTARPLLDTRPAEEIIFYDEFGLPR